MNKALFLDRDGTLNIEVGHLFRISDFEFIKGAPELIKKYKENGYKIIVITNQAGIAKGYYTEKDMHKLHKFINKELEKFNTRIDAFYFCHHHPDFTGECDCRKPKPGMILQAAKEFDIDLKNSILVGDKESDIEAGKIAGVGRLIKNETNCLANLL